MKGLCHLLCNCSTYRYVCIKHIFAWVVFNKSMISTKVSCSPSMSSKTRRETKKLPRYHQFGRLREADFWCCHGALGVWGGHIWLYDFDFGGWKEGMIGVTLLKKKHISPPSPYVWVDDFSFFQDHNERSLEGINVVEVFICLSYDMLINIE